LLSLTNNFFIFSVDDASGRYSTGWFWGNHYWTGSQSLCENIVPKAKPVAVTPEVKVKATTYHLKLSKSSMRLEYRSKFFISLSIMRIL
jgi:hypothetical protein